MGDAPARNILVIMTDQQRQDSLGCYGNGYNRTPNLDALAARGTRFERAYIANPICMPNRLSLFSGMNPRNHGLWTNGLWLEERPTVMSHLAARGWQTASFGKIHFEPTGGTLPTRECSHRWRSDPSLRDWHGPYWGFQHVEMTIGHHKNEGHYRHWLEARGGTGELWEQDEERGATPMPPDLHPSSYIRQRFGAWLAERRDPAKPFFAVASFPDPHHPFDPPREVAARWPVAEAPLPETTHGGGLGGRPKHYQRHQTGAWHRKGAIPPKHPEGVPEAEARRRVANTAAMIELVDENIGGILADLEARGLLENTLVVFTSDHGELLGDHGLWMKGPFFFEGLCQVPLIMAGPGVAAGATRSDLVSAIDLTPTLCGWSGEPIPYWVNGLDQSATLAGDVGSGERAEGAERPESAEGKSAPCDAHPRAVCSRDACLIEYRNGYGDADVVSKTLVTERYKYTRYETGEEELTDLREDPEERRNVVREGNYRAELTDLRMRLLDELLATESRYPAQTSHA